VPWACARFVRNPEETTKAERDWTFTCTQFERYRSVVALMRQTLMTYAAGDPNMKGIY